MTEELLAGTPTTDTEESPEYPTHLTALDLTKLDLAEHRVELARCRKLLRVHDYETALAKFQLRVKECDDSVRRHTRELVALREELGGTYGVNFGSDTVSYDDETGQIFVSEPASTLKE